MIDREDIGDVAVVRLAHGKVNALDLDLLTAIVDTFTELDVSPHRAIVLTGTARSFSAGVDLWRIIDGGEEYIEAFLPALSEAFLSVFNVGKPVVAAVNGHAIAGGAVLACCCDHRILADSGGRIGVTELQVGVPFPATALSILDFAMGAQRARGAVLGAGTYAPADALASGFGDELVAADDLFDYAVAKAVALSTQIPPDTFRLTKVQMRLSVNESLARHRPVYDPHTAELWIKRVNDGWIRRYLEQVTRRR